MSSDGDSRAASQRDQAPRIHTLSQIENVISSPKFATDLIDAIKDGFVGYSNGSFNVCPIQTMGAPPMAPFATGPGYAAQTCVKSGYVSGASHYVIKIASGGHPFVNSGSMQLYSQRTGELESILLDRGILTELRTAAAGAVAARLLAPDLSKGKGCIGILGTGEQARYQLRYLAHVTPCRAVSVWGRTKGNVQKFIADMTAEGWEVNGVSSPQELLVDCSLIVTTTSSRQALLQLASESKVGKAGSRKRRKLGIKHPLHITCIGSDATGKMELAPELVAAADLLVADSRLQTKERGEFEEALRQDLVSLDSIVELGELIEKEELHRQKTGEGDDPRLTIFDSSGVAVQDCVIATMVNEALKDCSFCDKCRSVDVEYECCACDSMMCADCAEVPDEPDKFHHCDGCDGYACGYCYSDKGQCVHRYCEQRYCNDCKKRGELTQCEDCGGPTCEGCEELWEACETRKARAYDGGGDY